MVIENLYNYLFIGAIAMGIVAMLMVWVFLYEAFKGTYILETDVMKRYVNRIYIFSLAVLSMQWITSFDIHNMLAVGFKIVLFGWVVTTIAVLGISVLSKNTLENKRIMRSMTIPCVMKVVCTMIVFWLIY